MGRTNRIKKAEVVKPPTVQRARLDQMSAEELEASFSMMSGIMPRTVVAVVMKMGRIRSLVPMTMARMISPDFLACQLILSISRMALFTTTPDRMIIPI